MAQRDCFIDGQWSAADGPECSSLDPATGEPTWRGRAATTDDVDRAVWAARGALADWAALPVSRRGEFLEAFVDRVKSKKSDLTDAICRTTGKPKWESATEVDAVIGKCKLTLDAHRQRHADSVQHSAGMTSATRFKPHGVCAVFGPFNFPAHLPNGHIMPALLAGNTVVFKPSEQCPLVGQLLAGMWEEAGLPHGVFNLLQGARDTGAALAGHSGVDGLFFTGSFSAGTAIARACADQPGKILALEMGGNNPLVVHRVLDVGAAVYWTIQSAFITAGQRCSCARRLIVFDDAQGASFVDRLVAATRRVVVGPFTQSPEPFMGPVISELAASRLLEAQEALIKAGAAPLLPMQSRGERKNILSPGILDCTGIDRGDTEHFGPLLQLVRVRSFDEAITEANNTRYGLAAALFSDDRRHYDEFYKRIRAGVVNWNRPTTGASGALPFGGIGNSGNHRPSAYFAIDYCAYPVGSLESEMLALPSTLSPGITL